ncbi:NADH-quinone oxidoreductase subunit J family protein [Heliorestis convoluta]|uniref:NADH-quinone oxidoreductase subunit J n=1 Tax=Heliorestis convoluta TaxID=356322 RepID=A0A5Q2N2P9_9FIRM|nr:NADH-quinone oxidoreductase subunit J [Heliorestis convoluta]QGG48149.1 Proton-translocating NADH-ubiquinone oxidoreductase, chain j [Heliorestis convoluta]
MNETIYVVAFYILAAIVLLSAIGVVVLKNIVHSALLLALTFVGVAGLYVLLNADYLAAVQVMVYAGAVAILIAFGVMLTRRPNMKESNPFNKSAVVGFVVAAGVFGSMAWAILSTTFPLGLTAPSDEISVRGVAKLLLEDYTVSFEAAALLLTVAMAGAIIIAKGAKKA